MKDYMQRLCTLKVCLFHLLITVQEHKLLRAYLIMLYHWHASVLT